jgi:hypothetical protein
MKELNDEKLTDEELDKLKRLNQTDTHALNLYKKLISEGEIERIDRIDDFLKNPKDSRKYLRTKKSVKSKTKRKIIKKTKRVIKKCKCKK